MKKILAIFLVMVMCMSLMACGGEVPAPDEEASEMDDLRIDAQLPEMEPLQQVRVHELFGTESVEMEFTDSGLTSALSWERDDGTTLYLEENEDQMYYFAIGTVKNLADSEIDFWSGLQAEVVVDGQNTYGVSMDRLVETVGPQATATFCLYTQIPKEILEVCETYALQFGFTDDFTPVVDLSECGNLYVLLESAAE